MHHIVQFCAAVMFMVAFIVPSHAQADKTDHPLISPYEGSTLSKKDVKAYDEYRLFKGWDKDTKDFITETLEGRVTKILYTNPKERSELEIYRNYEAALQAKGAEIIWTCNQNNNLECMETYVGATLRREFDINGISNKEGRYMIAKLEEEGQTAYIVVAVLQKVTDVHIIEMKAMDTDKVALNTQMLTDGLEKDGAVVLDGIYFDTDKATLKPSSKPAMDQIAAFLQAKPDLKVFVVGHTDMQGRLQHNMVLSQARAEAVVAALVNDYGLDGSRLAGHGVGSLAPASNNQTETGRAKNRRVVLVAQ